MVMMVMFSGIPRPGDVGVYGHNVAVLTPHEVKSAQALVSGLLFASTIIHVHPSSSTIIHRHPKVSMAQK